jgi:hypothetical protein
MDLMSLGIAFFAGEADGAEVDGRVVDGLLVCAKAGVAASAATATPSPISFALLIVKSPAGLWTPRQRRPQQGRSTRQA